MRKPHLTMPWQWIVAVNNSLSWHCHLSTALAVSLFKWITHSRQPVDECRYLPCTVVAAGCLHCLVLQDMGVQWPCLPRKTLLQTAACWLSHPLPLCQSHFRLAWGDFTSNSINDESAFATEVVLALSIVFYRLNFNVKQNHLSHHGVR